MSRAPAPLRHALTAAMLVAVAALPAASASAQTSTLNFNTLTPPAGAGFRNAGNCYTEAGYTVTAVGVACSKLTALATAGPAAGTVYTGSPALFLNDENATLIDFTRNGGGLFSFQSIQLAPFFGSATSVTFTGFGAGGSSVFRTVTLAAGSGLQGFTFADFTGLSSLRMAATNANDEPIVQFDNVVFSAAAVSAVPEPATFGLMFIGLAGMGAVARRRRST